MKQLIKEIEPYVKLYRDSKTGIAWVENGKTGNCHTAHPNIHSTGSVVGMKKLGYWEKNARTVRALGAIHNIDRCVVTDALDEVARQHCQCGGKH